MSVRHVRRIKYPPPEEFVDYRSYVRNSICTLPGSVFHKVDYMDTDTETLIGWITLIGGAPFPKARMTGKYFGAYEDLVIFPDKGGLQHIFSSDYELCDGSGVVTVGP